ncbi:hypothetical protein DICPUDRAFT_80975 [Dictyostelium purpureum]|uniref:Uncharacterized protein n=1 Tax=Dictyostelium purpureum TaxID=5786 RepID=F0ZS40_DICPU|nr:uncharacterized protein DICPUDRAFT_80975 [Dictyostelium purpureum]EGC33238.1 hypothetical protein DICPUDRAFT_80975 [Dictyostelium purpureum]|eukprot:XP_003290231.1 hypothetical protein DICPUDRAFT_80975 [Dictyostelium purpureum]
MADSNKNVILNCFSNSVIQKDIQQKEIVIVDTLFSIDGKYLVASNSIGCINIWNLDLSLHQKENTTTTTTTTNDENNNHFGQPFLDTQEKTIDSSFTDLFKPNAVYQAHPSFTVINKLHFFNESILMTAGENDIKVWNWSKIVELIGNSGGCIKIDPKSIYLASIESPRAEGYGGILSEKAEINCMDSQGYTLFFASGNNNAYSYDLEKKNIIGTFKGHTDYLHTIKYNSTFDNFLTSSEDSTVRIWDNRSSKCVSILNPFYKISFDLKNDNHNNNNSNNNNNNNNNNNITMIGEEFSYDDDPKQRLNKLLENDNLDLDDSSNDNKKNKKQKTQIPNDNDVFNSYLSNITPNSTKKSKSETNFNHWCGPLDLDETGNWLAVGGSTLSLWYLGQLNTMVSQLPVEESTYSILFNKEKIITAGSDGYVSYFALDGRPLMRVPSSSKVLYSLSYNQNKKNQILVAGGTSPFINTFINNENIAFSYYFVNDD